MVRMATHHSGKPLVDKGPGCRASVVVLSGASLRGDDAVRDFRDAMGMPGRVALISSRVMEPVALHPLRVLTGALLASGVITGALYAGHKLRQKRFGFRSPYDLHVRPPHTATTGGEYEAVGI